MDKGKCPRCRNQQNMEIQNESPGGTEIKAETGGTSTEERQIDGEVIIPKRDDPTRIWMPGL